VSPAARLAAAREQVGLLFDRATRAVEARLARERLRLAAASADLPRLTAARLASARSTLDASGAALAVLGPNATLERGYAIVRRAPDGAIVRDPTQAPGGTPLTIRVAHGEIGATVDAADRDAAARDDR
jgi:exodeoxyribonuclease VII large subunit